MTDLEAALAAGGKIGETDLDRALAAGGKVAPSIDAGPEARRAIFGGPKFPEPKTDEELGIDSGPIGDYSKRDVRRTLQGRNDSITTPEVREKRDVRAHREDVIANDPLAGMIAQGIPAAGAGIVAGGLTRLAAPAMAPLVQGAVTGAASSPDAPLTGAALGAIPGLPGAARAADRAIGEAAFNRATTAGFGDGPGPVARAAGKLTGMAVGSTHGPLGLLVGHDLGGRAASMFSKAGDAATSALARRWLDREIAGATVPDLGQLPPTSASATTPPLVSLAPLEHRGATLPTSVPPGALGTPFLDEISGEPITQAGQGGFLPEEAATNAGGKPAPSSLREDVARDARSILRSPIQDEPGEPPAPIESQLERSVRMLSELKSAARAGKVSSAQIQEALQAGMSPQAVAKTVGREAFERATQ